MDVRGEEMRNAIVQLNRKYKKMNSNVLQSVKWQKDINYVH